MSIIVCDHFLSNEDFERFREYVVNKKVNQDVINDSILTTDFWKHYGQRLQDLDLNPKCSGITRNVTVTNTQSPIGRHIDKNHHGERYKVLIYLNDVPNGGTLFYPPTGTRLVENKANRLVLFDLSILHESQKFDIRRQIKKIAIGFRLFANEPVSP
jgi:hypothetical protein